jgi:hypothetical protein
VFCAIPNVYDLTCLTNSVRGVESVNPISEIRMPKEIRNLKSESAHARSPNTLCPLGFGFLVSGFYRISAFGIEVYRVLRHLPDIHSKKNLVRKVSMAYLTYSLPANLIDEL